MPKTSKREEKNIKNQNFLRKILELKSELFSQFSPTVTKETKKRAWCEVHKNAINIGLIGHDKDVGYVRDATWPNLRNRTVLKVDQSQRTGQGGSKDSKFDDTDKLVLEIIGKESPVLEGLGVLDSMENTNNTNDVKKDLSQPFDQLEEDSTRTSDIRVAAKKKVIVSNKQDAKYLQQLKIKKLQLEVRKLELEVWEKERNLHVKHSSLTETFVTETDPLLQTDY